MRPKMILPSVASGLWNVFFVEVAAQFLRFHAGVESKSNCGCERSFGSGKYVQQHCRGNRIVELRVVVEQFRDRDVLAVS